MERVRWLKLFVFLPFRNMMSFKCKENQWRANLVVCCCNGSVYAGSPFFQVYFFCSKRPIFDFPVGELGGQESCIATNFRFTSGGTHCPCALACRVIPPTTSALSESRVCGRALLRHQSRVLTSPTTSALSDSRACRWSPRWLRGSPLKTPF